MSFSRLRVTSAPLSTRFLPTVAAAVLLASCAGAPGADSGPDPDSSSEAPEAGAAAYPAEVSNCGRDVVVEEPPEGIVTLNQGATEVALALGLQDRMVGTAYLDDEISAQWADAYESVPVLAQEYPSLEQFLSAEPDFAYASYASAFTAEVVGNRHELAEQGVHSYVSPFSCPEGEENADPTLDAAWQEARDIAALTGVPDRAQALIEEQQGQIEQVSEQQAGEGLSIFWFDSGTETPFVGAGGGGPQLLLDTVGAQNVFGDLDGGWQDGSWERVVEADPDVIVFADASWSSAQEKMDYLAQDPVLSELEAVQDESYATLVFSETTPGIRLADGAQHLSEQLLALADQ